MNQKAIIFGDIHAEWKAVEIILNEARRLGIDIAVNLGDDRAHFGDDDYETYMLWETFRRFLNEKEGRRLIAVFGEHNARPPIDIASSYVGAGSERVRIEDLIYRQDNVIAGHNGEYISAIHGPSINGYSGHTPLVVLNGHIHCITIQPNYRRIDENEKSRLRFLTKEQTHKLEPGRVYWVNPGKARWQEEYSKNYINFAIYDPQRLEVILKSINVGYWN